MKAAISAPMASAGRRTDLHRQDRQQPHAGQCQRTAKHPAKHQHPAAGTRHARCQGRKGRDQQIGQGEAKAESREDGEDFQRAARKGEADGCSKERGGAGRRQQRGKRAGGEMAAQAGGMRAVRIMPAHRDVGDGAGQRDFEQAPEIGGEAGDQDHHEDQEQRLLELDSPTHR